MKGPRTSTVNPIFSARPTSGRPLAPFPYAPVWSAVQAARCSESHGRAPPRRSAPASVCCKTPDKNLGSADELAQ